MFSRPKRPTHAIDMAPLIDVVFLLLIFFMLSSNFIEPSLPLKLPRASGETPPAQEALVVALNAAGVLQVAGQTVQMEEFESRLAEELQKRPGAAIHFRGDREAAYGDFVDLMDRARRIGASQFHLIHEPRPANE